MPPRLGFARDIKACGDLTVRRRFAAGPERIVSPFQRVMLIGSPTRFRRFSSIPIMRDSSIAILENPVSKAKATPGGRGVIVLVDRRTGKLVQKTRSFSRQLTVAASAFSIDSE